MSIVVEGLTTKSDQIRALLREGYVRTEIAKFLNVRYQHVRGVAVHAGIADGLQRGLVVVPKSKPIPKITEEVAIDILLAAGFPRLGSWVVDGGGRHCPRCARAA